MDSMQKLMDEMNKEIDAVVEYAVSILSPVKPKKKFFMCQNIYVMDFANFQDYMHAATCLTIPSTPKGIVRVAVYPANRRIVLHL